MGGFIRRLEQTEAQLDDDSPETQQGWLERILESVRRR
jgi:hypothetical protein